MLALCLSLALHSAGVTQGSAPARDASVIGVVRDQAGGIVAGAAVAVRSASGGERQGVTGPDGRFSIQLQAPSAPEAELVLVIRAGGFAEKRQTLAPGAPRQDLVVILSPATVLETITVTPARGEERLGDVPASVTVLAREDIRQSPAAIVDDLLRSIPTFSLFRRTSSLAAHPTTQGVSLRGIGPSGVSRTLVLLDGVPFNDPFGGWVYWTRVPIERAERIEVVDGTSSSLYGNYAMGGVINIVTARATPRTLELRTHYGNLVSPKLDVSASDVRGKAGMGIDVTTYRTAGYTPVVAVNPAGVAERGLVDNNASVRFTNVNVRTDYDPTARLHTFIRAGYFHESRNNGKHSTIDQTPEANSTTWKSATGGVTFRLSDQSSLEANVVVDVERLHSNALAVPTATPARSIGRMTLVQRVPTTASGGMVQWRRSLTSRQVVSAGFDWHWVDGDSQEDGLDAATGTTVTLKRVSGGTQRSLGVFAQDIIRLTSSVTLTAGARIDAWRSYDAHNLESNYPSGVPTANDNPALPARRDTAVSPRVAAIYKVTPRVSVWGDIAAGFRAPTLNELYRGFRVGTITTLANNQLGPERLVGGEVGVHVVPRRHLTWRATWFSNRIKDPVSNATISTSGANVTQQRQNLGKTRVAGIQTDVEYRLGGAWKISGGYVYDRARVTENPSNTAVIGKFLPQVPRHRGTVQVAFAHPKYANVTVDVLAIGAQFDDDLNARVVPGYTRPGLPAYGVVSLSASRAFGPRLQVFFGVQNLLAEQYFVGTLPTTVGSPRLVSGGVRVRLTGR